MNQELLFGAAYYPEYMPYDRIETDIEMMKRRERILWTPSAYESLESGI